MNSSGYSDKSERIQQVADELSKFKFSVIDRSAPLILEKQLFILGERLTEHLVDVLGERESSEIKFVHTAILDSNFALEGILAAIESQRSRPITSLEVSGIAKRSYGVLWHLALVSGDAVWRRRSDPLTPLTVDERKAIHEGSSRIEAIKLVRPEILEYVEGSAPFVKVKRASEEIDWDMPCPAFRGPSGPAGRYPAQLWPMFIDVNEACGKFNVL